MSNQKKDTSNKDTSTSSNIEKHAIQSRATQKSKALPRKTLEQEEENIQSNEFITQIPAETQKQLDKLREKHRQRMQQERVQYQEQLEQPESQQSQRQSFQEVDHWVTDQKHSQFSIRYMKPDAARKESMAIIEQGKQRRQKMIENNLNKLHNKLNQDAHKIDETIDLLRIEIVETQRDIKEKAKIEKESLQEYHSSMHKQISDLLKMKQNIIHNQQQISISHVKSQQKKGKRSISESIIRKSDFIQPKEQKNSVDPIREFDFMHNNSSQLKENTRKNNKFHSPQRSELIHSFSMNDESLYYSEERQQHNDDRSNDISQEQYTFNSKPLFQKMEEKYQSKVVLPNILEREGSIKQRSEYYRKRMEPLKLFKDHEKKYEEVKEIKEKVRNDKITQNQKEQKQHSLEKHTKSQTYVKVQNEEHQKKENQKKKDIMKKILQEKQKSYQPSGSDQSQILRRSYSSSEISMIQHKIINNNIKASHQPYLQISNEQLTQKEKMLKGIENHKADMVKREKVFKTHETSADQSITEQFLMSPEKQQSGEQQAHKQRSKRKILTQKFHGENSPLPEVFISDDYNSPEKKKNGYSQNSKDLIEARREPQFTQFLSEMHIEKVESERWSQQISTEKKKNNEDLKPSEQKKGKQNNYNEQNLSKEKTEKDKNQNLEPKQIFYPSTLSEEQVKNYKSNKQLIQSENRDKTPNTQKRSHRQTTDDRQKQSTEKPANSISRGVDQLDFKKEDIKFETPQKQNDNTSPGQVKESQESNKIISTTAHFKSDGHPHHQYNSNESQGQLQNQKSSFKNELDKVDKRNSSSHQSNQIKEGATSQIQSLSNQKYIGEEKRDLLKMDQPTNMTKNTSLPSIEKKTSHFDDRVDPLSQLRSQRKKRSPQRLAGQASKSYQDLLQHHNSSIQDGHNVRGDQNGSDNDILKMYKQFKSIKNKSKRSSSEISNSRNVLSSQSQIFQKNEYIKNKYKDYMHDVKEKYKLERQIDDWKKIDRSDLLNNQQKIKKLSEKVQYLDNKLQQMQDIAKQNKGNSQQFESVNEDAILINSVQAKIAILNKLN